MGIETLSKGISSPQSTKNLHKDIFFNLNQLEIIEKKKDVFILLSIVFSYYLNGEKLANKTKLQKVLLNIFTKLKLDEFLDLDELKKTKHGDEHLKYIINHFLLYLSNLKKRNKYKKGEIDLETIIRETNDTGIDGFRERIVVHQYNRLNPNRKSNNAKFYREKTRIINSKFIFPPVSYIQPLIESLNKILNNPKINPFKKAAYLYGYIFLIHPFEDGNSRASRILSTSRLEYHGHKFMRLGTFLSETQNGLPNYLTFLEENIYKPFQQSIKPHVVLSEETQDGEVEITKYISIKEYEKFIIQVCDKYYEQLLITADTINKHLDKINYMINFILCLAQKGYKSKSAQAYITNKLFYLLTENKINFKKNILNQLKEKITLSENGIRRYNLSQDDITNQLIKCHNVSK